MKRNRIFRNAIGLSLVLHAGLLTLFLRLPAPQRDLAPTIADHAHTLDERPFSLYLKLDEDEAAPEANPAADEINPEPTPRPNPPESSPKGAAHTGTSSAPTSPSTNHTTGSGAGTGASRQARGVSFFEMAAPARSVVYVLDRSVSMGLNGTLEVVKSELRASLSRLPLDARFQVVFYNRHVEPLRRGFDTGLLDASAENLALLARQLDSLNAEGGTDHLPALRAALALQPDAIYFLTDADDLGPETLRAVARLNNGATAIHTIELVRSRRWDQGNSPLYRLAQNNRGAYIALRVAD